MKKIATLILSAACGFSAMAQTTITNGGFENWGNTVPANDANTEPTNWYSNQSGSNVAQLGGQTCFKDSTTVHSGNYSVRVETITVQGIGVVVNGNVTTGVVNAPTLTKTDGYIGTENFSDSTTDIRRMSFTGRPDSLVGWYQYTSGGSGEQGKVRAILHTGQYYDSETPTTYHGDASANKIADALFLTPTSSVNTWTRFSIPFTYISSDAPAYIMINATSSADQNTTVTGSKMWLDDLQAVYSSTGITTVALQQNDVKVYAAGKTVYINIINGNEGQSSFSIYDLSGRKVFAQNITNKGFNSFDLSYLSTGIYVYKLNNTDLCEKGKLFIQ